MTGSATTPRLRRTPPKEGNDSPSLKGWQAKPDAQFPSAGGVARSDGVVVPKLRFPEFWEAGEWEANELGTVAVFVNEKISVEQVALENYVSTENILQDFGGVARASKLPTMGAVTRFRPLDTLVSNIRPYLKKVWVADKEGGASNDVIVIRAKQRLLPQYFSFLLKNDAFIDYVMTGAKGVKMPRGDIGSMKAYPALYPTKPEQQKIADCLASLDERITLEAQKLDTLKTHKKGLMQQLFPAEDETLPKLRFPEFRDAGEWEAKLLGTVCEMQAGKFVAASEISESQSEGLYPCLGGNGLRGYTKTFNQSGRYSLIGRQGALCGNVNLAEGNFYATEHAVVTTPKPGNNTDWLFYNLCLLNLNRFATGQAQPGLSIDVLEKVNCATPKDEKEQQKIADCLASLDDLITAQTQKLAALKTHKKGLMQQLFPNQAGA